MWSQEIFAQLHVSSGIIVPIPCMFVAAIKHVCTVTILKDNTKWESKGLSLYPFNLQGVLIQKDQESGF